MAFELKEIKIVKKRILAPLSRYTNSKVYQYGSLPKVTFETYKRGERSPSNEGVVLITPGWEYRPDLVSFDLYGFPDLWWKIMEYNGIKDILDFKAGVTLQIPRTSE